jgi:hypothetical protein
MTRVYWQGIDVCPLRICKHQPTAPSSASHVEATTTQPVTLRSLVMQWRSTCPRPLAAAGAQGSPGVTHD